jgi:hypothetical protein
MFKKLGILELALAAFSIVAPSAAQPRAYHGIYYPQQYIYRRGRWQLYRGYGHPYRGGYYDGWGHWHRIVAS